MVIGFVVVGMGLNLWGSTRKQKGHRKCKRTQTRKFETIPTPEKKLEEHIVSGLNVFLMGLNL